MRLQLNTHPVFLPRAAFASQDSTCCLHHLDLTIRDCNPGTIFQSQDFGIEKRQSQDPGIDPGIGN